MKKIKTLIILSVMGLFLSGCMYTNIRSPLDRDFDKTELGSKQGYSEAQSVLWLFAWGDGGTKAAADQGNVTVIRHADIELFNVFFGLYARARTVVYGD